VSAPLTSTHPSCSQPFSYPTARLARQGLLSRRLSSLEPLQSGAICWVIWRIFKITDWRRDRNVMEGSICLCIPAVSGSTSDQCSPLFGEDFFIRHPSVFWSLHLRHLFSHCYAQIAIWRLSHIILLSP
jgi:hypothetical protein